MDDTIRPITLQNLSDTKWFCRLDVLSSIIFNFTVIHKTLEEVPEKN
jgi:hypothetical protein